MKVNLPQWKAQYARLRARFKHLGWISEGYVQDRGPGAGGPCYQWTRKVQGKTVSVALSGNNMNGYARPLPTGAKSNTPSRKCSDCPAKSSSPPCPIRLDVSDWAKEF